MSDLTLTPNGLPGAPLDEPIVAGVSPLKASTRRFAKNHLAVVSCFVLGCGRVSSHGFPSRASVLNRPVEL